nr:hypothetical protein [Tanacetum cinerariifolium]
MTELTLEESLRMFVDMTAKRLDENYNLIKELRAFMDFAFRNQEASIKSLEIQVRQMSIILHEKLAENLRCSTKIKPRVDDETISNYVETATSSICRIEARQYVVSNLQNKSLFSESKETAEVKDLEAYRSNAMPLGKALPRKEKDPWSFTLNCFINNMRFDKA